MNKKVEYKKVPRCANSWKTKTGWIKEEKNCPIAPLNVVRIILNNYKACGKKAVYLKNIKEVIYLEGWNSKNLEISLKELNKEIFKGKNGKAVTL